MKQGRQWRSRVDLVKVAAKLKLMWLKLTTLLNSFVIVYLHVSIMEAVFKSIYVI